MIKRNLLKFFILCIVSLVLVIGGTLYLVNNKVKYPLKSNEEKVKFQVTQKESLVDVIEDLSKNNNIKSKQLLKWYVNRNYGNVTIKSGEYSFSKNIPLEKFVRYLKVGIKDDQAVKVSIPEGYDIEHIGQTLEKKGIISKADFIKSCKEYELPSFIKKDSRRRYALEGYLFPDTYQFLKGSSGKEIIDAMLNRFSEVINTVEKDSGKSITIEDLDKIITMASLIEKEVDIQDERGKAASVFYNRLNKNMKLQSCATVLYALGVHKDKLYYKDLKINSPYNTYIVEGLPAGPISNPGKECIKAALNPEKTNYLFFVSNNDGTHFFSDNEKKFLEVKKITQGE